MGAVSAALSDLENEATARVIEWAAKRYGVAITATADRKGQVGSSNDGAGYVGVQYKHFVDLFDAAGPNTDAERALVATYWFQEIRHQPSFQAQELNNALKDVGHGVGNITDALSSLQNRKPALVRQMAKSGRARQARKTYKLTTAGMNALQTMVSAAIAGHEE